MALGVAAGPAAASAPPTVGGCSLFPPFTGTAAARSAAGLAAWNQDVSRSPRDPRSRGYVRRIRRLGGNQFLHPDFGSNPSYGIPYTTVGPGQPPTDVKVDAYPDESDFGLAPIPDDAPIEAGSDRHVLVVDTSGCDLYEMGAASYDAARPHPWHAGATAMWSLDSAALRRGGHYVTSADAAGLPILAGLVRYQEVASGAVHHAIRVTFDTTRRAFAHPATHWASSSCGRNLPPMGLRLRLTRRYYRRHLSRFPADSQSRPIFRALYHYGLFVADNGGNWFFTGQTNPNWDDQDLDRLKDVPGRAFVVVDSKAGLRSDC